MATIESLQAQVIALQASEAKLTAEVDLLQGHIEEYKGEWEDALAGSAPLTMYSNDPKDWENHPFLKDKVAEVEKLKTSLQTMNEVLEGSAGQKIESLQAEVMALQELWLKEQAENEKLKAENEQLNDDDWVIDCHKALKYKIVLTEEYYAELTSGNEQLEAENEKLFKFITGGGEAKDVEEIIDEKMSKEFIDSNKEHWEQMELFQEVESEVDMEAFDVSILEVTADGLMPWVK